LIINYNKDELSLKDALENILFYSCILFGWKISSTRRKIIP